MNRPDNMTRAEWKRLGQAARDAIELKQEHDHRIAAMQFEDHMRYYELATPELTWLRDRVRNLEEQVHILMERTKP